MLSIGPNAFQGCTSLSQVNLPPSLTSLSVGTFYGCISLTTITIPASVEVVQKMSFAGCTSLSNVTFRGAVASIDANAFSSLTSGGLDVASVTIPAGLDSLGGHSQIPGLGGVVCPGAGAGAGCSCAAGYNGATTTATTTTLLTCSPCTPGTFKPTASSAACTPCAPGSFMPLYKTKSTAKSDCQLCTPGSFSFAPGGGACAPCNPGSYAAARGASVCTLCPRNQATNHFGATACSNCTDGKITLSEGSLACISPQGSAACSAGQVSSTGLAPCEACSPGKFQPSAAQTACKDCPPGSIATGSGQGLCVQCPATQIAAQQAQVCRACPAGQQPSQNQTQCVDCPPGQFSQVASFLDAGYQVCDSCAAGFYSPTFRSEACLSCPPDSISQSSGASACAPCKSGFTQSAGGQSFCVATSSSSSLVTGLLSNKGTPLYVIALVALLAGVFSVALNFAKTDASKGLIFVPSLLKVLGEWLLFAAATGAEMVLASGLVASGSASLRGYGVLMIVSRTCLGVAPALYVLTDVAAGSRSLLVPLLGSAHLSDNSKLYGAVLCVALLEPRLLAHLPWLAGDFISVCGFPSLGLLRLCLAAQLVQLVATFVAQLGVLFAEQQASASSDEGSSFFVVLLLNVGFSSVKLAVSLLEIVLRFNVLAPAAAAAAAATIVPRLTLVSASARLPSLVARARGSSLAPAPQEAAGDLELPDHQVGPTVSSPLRPALDHIPCPAVPGPAARLQAGPAGD